MARPGRQTDYLLLGEDDPVDLCLIQGGSTAIRLNTFTPIVASGERRGLGSNRHLPFHSLASHALVVVSGAVSDFGCHVEL